MNSTTTAINLLWLTFGWAKNWLNGWFAYCIHIPTGREWLLGLCVLIIYALVSISFGLWQGFLQWNLIPLNGLIFFDRGRSTFVNPVFLTLAALLGLACTITYLFTGSIWIPVIIYWLAVIVWLLCLGGIDRRSSTAL